MELCSVLRASLDGRRVSGRKDTCICMAESLHYSPETTTALLISYPPIQNIFGIKKKCNKWWGMFRIQMFWSCPHEFSLFPRRCRSLFYIVLLQSLQWILTPASFSSPSSGRSVLLCWPHFLLWWRPWWEVFCEHLFLSLILVDILWFGWSMQPEQGPCFRKPKRELKLGALLLVFTNLSLWSEPVLRYLMSSSILLVVLEVKVTCLFYFRGLWPQISPEHSWYWGHA